MLDMATTQVAGNKYVQESLSLCGSLRAAISMELLPRLTLAERLGVPLPTTWITEPDGTIIAEEVLPGEHVHW